MSFENISKGEFKIANDLYPCDINCDNRLFATVYRDKSFIASEKEKQDAKFIAYCFNLQQHYDIGCYEEVIKLLEKTINPISHEDSLILKSEIEQILNKAKR